MVSEEVTKLLRRWGTKVVSEIKVVKTIRCKGDKSETEDICRHSERLAKESSLLQYKADAKDENNSTETDQASIPLGIFASKSVSCRISKSDLHKKSAFTLAEVLITLGIIGVVAALTIPTLVQNYRQHVVETRLQKFYTTFNQAITMAEAQYGDKKEWYWDASGVELDKDGNPIEATSKVDQWFNKYLSQFITIKKKVDKTGYVLYYLPDGSAFSLGVAGQPSLRDMRFYPGDPERCTGERILTSGTCAFAFEYYPISTSPAWKFLYNKGLEPTKYNWN